MLRENKYSAAYFTEKKINKSKAKQREIPERLISLFSRTQRVNGREDNSVVA